MGQHDLYRGFHDIPGPGRSAEFFHGTTAHLQSGDMILSNRERHLQEGRKHLDPEDAWAHEDLEREAEHLAPTTFMTTKHENARTFGRHVYRVEPTGHFSDDHTEHNYEVSGHLRVLGKVG